MKLTLIFNSSKALVIGSLSIVLISSASAATINVSLFDEESDLVNTAGTGGSVVSASNFGNAPSPSLTVNGIAHITGSANDTNLTMAFGFQGDFRNGGTGFVADSNKVQELFSGIAGANGLTMAVGGLTAGQEYLFQAYWEHNGSGNTLVIDIEGDSLSSVASQAAPAATPGGTLISYQFIAGDDTLNAVFDRDGANADTGDVNNWLSGYSLQTIPEPSTALLGAIGALALLRRRRA